MWVKVAVDRCIGSGNCVLAAPEVFDQNGDGVVELVVDRPSLDQYSAVRDASARCPASVIQLDEGD